MEATFLLRYTFEGLRHLEREGDRSNWRRCGIELTIRALALSLFGMKQWRCFLPMSTAIVVVLTLAVASGAYAAGSGVAAHTGAVIDPQIVTSDSAFGVALFKTLSRGHHGNIAISPVSIALAPQIAYNGAVGTTRQSMAQTLDLGSLSTQQLNKANAALQASLRDADPQVQLTIANSLWGHLDRHPMSPSFTQAVETFYGAKVGDLSEAPSNVNAWVAKETPRPDYADSARRARELLRKGHCDHRQCDLLQRPVEQTIRCKVDCFSAFHVERRHHDLKRDDATDGRVRIFTRGPLSSAAYTVRPRGG